MFSLPYIPNAFDALSKADTAPKAADPYNGVDFIPGGTYGANGLYTPPPGGKQASSTTEPMPDILDGYGDIIRQMKDANETERADLQSKLDAMKQNIMAMQKPDIDSARIQRDLMRLRTQRQATTGRQGTMLTQRQGIVPSIASRPATDLASAASGAGLSGSRVLSPAPAAPTGPAQPRQTIAAQPARTL